MVRQNAALCGNGLICIKEKLVRCDLTLYHIIQTFIEGQERRLLKNIVAKGENAGNHYFLLFQQCIIAYQRLQTRKNLGLFGRELILEINETIAHYHTIPHFDAPTIYSCGKLVRKGRIACNKQFLFFS